MNKAININNENKRELLKGLVLVDFWAEWCGPCKTMLPIIDNIAETFKEVQVYKINVEEVPDITKDFGIRRIPTILIIKDGDLKKMFVGEVEHSKITSELEKYI